MSSVVQITPHHLENSIPAAPFDARKRSSKSAAVIGTILERTDGLFYSAGGARASIHFWLLRERHRIPKVKLGALAVPARYGEHRLENRHQLPLRRRHNRAGDLRLLPENLPVRLLGRLYTIQFRLSCVTLAAREKVAQWHV